MTRFLSRNKINTSGWAPVVVAGKDDCAVKAREDGKRILQLILFTFSLSVLYIIELSRLSLCSVCRSRR